MASNIKKNKALELSDCIFKVPEKLEELGFHGYIYFRKATKYREGSLEHIIKSHHSEMNYDTDYVGKIIETILNPNECCPGKKQYRFELTKYFYSIKKINSIVDVWFKVVIEKEISNDNFSVVTAHPYKKRIECRENHTTDFPIGVSVHFKPHSILYLFSLYHKKNICQIRRKI